MISEIIETIKNPEEKISPDNFTKEGWQALHTVFSIAFVVLSIFHLFTVNWKAFLSYLKIKKQNGLNKKREFYWSTTLVLLFFLGIAFSVPPFQTIMNLGEYFTESWEKVEEEPPIPHAELLTLVEMAEQMKLTSVDEITQKLILNKINFDNINQNLLELAAINNTTPLEIYQLISKNPETEKQGSGIGRKTIEEFASELNRKIDDVIQILQENNIKAEKGQTLREIGENNDIPPRHIFNLISAE